MYGVQEYHRPETLAAAVVLLRDLPGARPLAGGTDLLVASREKGSPCATLVDLKGVPELKGITRTGDGLHLGAMTTAHEIAGSPEVASLLSPLAEAARQLGSYQLRHRATVGGNLCNASPAAETACPLLVADTVVALASAGGTREMPLAEFLVGPGRTAIAPGEIMIGLSCPAPAAPRATYAGAYIKHGPRKAMDIAIVNMAVWLGLVDGRVADARIALGSVAPKPFRVPAAEAVLIGQSPGEDLARQAGRAARGAATPISDPRAGAWYRAEMVEELVTRGIMTAFGRSAR
ncbi:MAG TPA: FAD binding domain-containing protein [Bacillota bacterium]|jgi:carbon-monoxide dehydrogenase medium subunit